MEDSNPELEYFRKQWKEEVTRRTTITTQSLPGPSTQVAGTSHSSRRPPRPQNIYEAPKTADDDSTVEPQILHFDGPSGNPEAVVDDDFHPHGKKNGINEPQSALEHYEKAVEREGQGSLGDSLDLYRKAFRVSLVLTELTLQSFC